MHFDFTPDETDNALFLREALQMSGEELIESYIEKMRCRAEGGDAAYNLGMCLNILTTVAHKNGVQFPNLPEAHVISGYIKQIDTPESGSLEGYGYDIYERTLYIKYKSGDKVYAFYEVSTERFEEFRKAESKGKEAAKIRKEFSGKN